MKLVCISDTHLYQAKLPDGDILVHAGDLTYRGTESEIKQAADWLESLSFQHKIVVPGNHDFLAQSNPQRFRQLMDAAGVTVLIDQLDDELQAGTGIRIYGSPWVPTFGAWAYMCSEERLRGYFERIPGGLNVLVTHGPPYKVLDETMSGQHAGSTALWDVVTSRKPQHHVFGHIHEGYGSCTIGGINFHNVAVLDDFYRPANEPLVIEVF